MNFVNFINFFFFPSGSVVVFFFFFLAREFVVVVVVASVVRCRNMSMSVNANTCEYWPISVARCNFGQLNLSLSRSA